MNMQQFTTKQLEVMALESSPRGLQARKELEKRKTKEASEKSVEKAKQAPKKRTRKPRKTTTKQSEETQKDVDKSLDKDSGNAVESPEQTKDN